MKILQQTDEFRAIRFRRGAIFSFEEFLHSFDKNDRPQADVTYITGIDRPVGAHSYKRSTLIIDLKPSPEHIFNHFQDSTRNKINQVRKNDLCSHKMIIQPSSDDMDKLKVQFTAFAEHIGGLVVNMNYLHGLNNAGRLNLSYVYDRKGHMLTGHVYRLSHLRPELLHSFRAVEPGASAQRATFVSKANRYSHHLDMLHFRERANESYDFGGVSLEMAAPCAKWRAIDEFKISFGGSVSPLFNSILYNTAKSKLYLRLRGDRL